MNNSDSIINTKNDIADNDDDDNYSLHYDHYHQYTSNEIQLFDDSSITVVIIVVQQ